MATPFHDVALGERLSFQNVVSHRTKCHYTEMAAQFDEFVSQVKATGSEPVGPLFYSLNNVPMDEMVDIETFLPIRQGTFPRHEDFLFHSYVDVSPLLRGIVKGKFEEQTEAVYTQLLATLEANDLEINSPFYHVFQKDPSPFVLVYVGYVDPDQSAP